MLSADGESVTTIGDQDILNTEEETPVITSTAFGSAAIKVEESCDEAMAPDGKLSQLIFPSSQEEVPTLQPTLADMMANGAADSVDATDSAVPAPVTNVAEGADKANNGSGTSVGMDGKVRCTEAGGDDGAHNLADGSGAKRSAPAHVVEAGTGGTADDDERVGVDGEREMKRQRREELSADAKAMATKLIESYFAKGPGVATDFDFRGLDQMMHEKYIELTTSDIDSKGKRESDSEDAIEVDESEPHDAVLEAAAKSMFRGLSTESAAGRRYKRGLAKNAIEAGKYNGASRARKLELIQEWAKTKYQTYKVHRCTDSSGHDHL